MHGPTIFECKDGPCSGFKISYHPNGQIKIVGRFEHGRPIDSVITYLETGQILDRRFYFEGKLFRSLTYYPNGQIQRDLNWNQKKEIKYFLNGKIESLTSFRKKYFQKIYYPSGQIKVDENRECKKTYSENLKLKTSWTRQEVLKFERIFKKQMPFFEYTYKEYDDSLRIIKEAIFFDHNINWAGFYYPETFEKIDLDKLNSVIYYNKSGFQIKKEIYKWEIGTNEKKKNVYFKVGDSWRQE
jgi:antitoxin component YwqK of YwqJK toxin-antitoxin module